MVCFMLRGDAASVMAIDVEIAAFGRCGRWFLGRHVAGFHFRLKLKGLGAPVLDPASVYLRIEGVLGQGGP